MAPRTVTFFKIKTQIKVSFRPLSRGLHPPPKLKADYQAPAPSPIITQANCHLLFHDEPAAAVHAHSATSSTACCWLTLPSNSEKKKGILYYLFLEPSNFQDLVYSGLLIFTTSISTSFNKKQLLATKKNIKFFVCLCFPSLNVLS